ncbi:hypothetical protein GCM10018773_06880 [Streptomyces candidus]|nr:hypothetical protein GCM10018773_06880 [Streptomyces candidus]
MPGQPRAATLSPPTGVTTFMVRSRVHEPVKAADRGGPTLSSAGDSEEPRPTYGRGSCCGGQFRAAGATRPGISGGRGRW